MKFAIAAAILLITILTIGLFAQIVPSENFASHFFLSLSPATSGDLDPTFNGTGKVVTPIEGSYDSLTTSFLLADGKIVVVGNTFANSTNNFALARFNSDGTFDTTYGNGGVQLFDVPFYGNESIADAKMQADGKIVVAGSVFNGADDDLIVARFNIDGTFDTSFGTDGYTVSHYGVNNNSARSLVIQSDGKIVAGGESFDGTRTIITLARYDSNGSIDAGFDTDGFLEVDLSPNPGGPSSLNKLQIQSDGKLLLLTSYFLARLLPDGTFDPTFDVDGKTNSSLCTLGITVQPDGRIVTVGRTDAPGFTTDATICRTNVDGSIDIIFNSGGSVVIPIFGTREGLEKVIVQSDGKILATGSSNQLEYGSTLKQDPFTVRLNANGSFDTSFDSDGMVTTSVFVAKDDEAQSVLLQPDGKIIVGAGSELQKIILLRYSSNGTLDPAFDSDGRLITNFSKIAIDDQANAIALQSDGKIIVAGVNTSNFALVRYNLNGTIDDSFGLAGRVTTTFPGGGSAIANGVKIQPDGKIVAVGSKSTQFAISRYTTTGALDLSFSADGMVTTPFQTNDFAKAVVIQPDGKIVVAGYTDLGGSNIAVARYNTNGALDPTFDGDGKVTTEVGPTFDIAEAVALQSDGKIVVAGSSSVSNNEFSVVRYNSNGSLDTTFDTDGKVITPVVSGATNEAKGVAIQSDGKIVLAGRAYVIGSGNFDIAVVRYNPDGSLDTSFSGDGIQLTAAGPGDDVAYSVVIQADGKILVGGESSNGSNKDFVAVRYNSDGSLDNTLWGTGGIKLIPVGTGDDSGRAMALQDDGRVLLAGNTVQGIDSDFGVVRLLGPTLPSMDISNASVAEGNAGTVQMSFDVTLSAPSSQTVTVNYASQVLTATPGVDYIAVTSTALSFNPGETVKTVTVTVNGDTTYELNETLKLVLSDAVNANLGNNEGIGTIINDDVIPTFSINDASVAEGNGGFPQLSFTVTLSEPSGVQARVNYATSDITATSSGPLADYFTEHTTTLTFNPGETTKIVLVTAVGDTLYDGNETFNVDLSDPISAGITDAVGVGTILDDDTAPTITVTSTIDMFEGDIGTSVMTLAVDMSTISGTTSSVNISTNDITATAGSDYQALLSVPVVFASGEFYKIVNITIIGDTNVENDETFGYSIGTPVGATILNGQGIATIRNDDSTTFCTPAPVGLTSWYRGENNALDTRSWNDGALVNGTGFVSGKIGQAFSFDGIDDNVELGNWFTYTNFTISMWVKPGATQVQSANILDNNHTGGQNWVLQQDDNNTNVYAFSGTPNFSLAPNVWQHVVLTHDDTNMSRVYVNGVLTVSGSFAITYNGTQFLRVGRWGNSLGFSSNRNWNGQLDELSLFDRSFSLSEIQAIYYSGTAGMCKPTAKIAPSGLAGWWAGDGDANDISDNGNNGTLQNGAGFSVSKVGQGFSLDGTDDYISTNLDVQPTAMPSMTFEAWVYPTRPNHPFDQAIFSGDDGGYDRQLGIAPNGLTFRVQTGSPTTFDAATVDYNQWQHVAVVYTPTDIKLYKNGIEFNSGIAPVGQASTNKLVFGSNRCPPCVSGGATQQYQGNIDEASIYNRVLSEAEIKSIFNAGLAGKHKTTTSDTTPLSLRNGQSNGNNLVGDVTANFPNVSVAGITQQVPLDLTLLPPLPMGVATTGLTYDVDTDAIYTGNPTLCFNVPSLSALNAANLRIYHLENEAWVDRTAVGGTHSALCTNGVTSLSPFAIGSLAPTAADVSVSGRVTTENGNGIRNAVMTLSGSNGDTRIARTGGFGYYRFDGVPAGETFVLSISTKRFTFAEPSRIIFVTDNIADIDFTAVSVLSKRP